MLAGRLPRGGLSAGRRSRGRTDARTFWLAVRPPRCKASCPAPALLDDEVVLLGAAHLDDKVVLRELTSVSSPFTRIPPAHADDDALHAPSTRFELASGGLECHAASSHEIPNSERVVGRPAMISAKH